MADKITIRNRWTDAALYEGEHETLREAVEASYGAGACLAGAALAGADLKYAGLVCFDLRGADLRGADLKGADLAGADLAGADLTGADLKDANLRDANLTGADLRGADLAGADLAGADLTGADLAGADLTGADLKDADLKDANLRDANLTDANLPPAPVVQNIDAAILAACNDGEHLNMLTWHCGTVHCRAGWAVTLAGDAGRELESAIGTNAAAALIYAASTPGGCVVPDWFASKEDALADMRARVNKEPTDD